MNSLNAFILLELFTFRASKKYKYDVISDFRHIVVNYIYQSNCYNEFINKLDIYPLYLNRDIFTLCRRFSRYVKFVYKIWNGFNIS